MNTNRHGANPFVNLTGSRAGAPVQNTMAMNEPRLNLPEVTVSELSASLKRTVEDAYGYVRVRGEVSGYKGRMRPATLISRSRTRTPKSTP